MKLVQAVDFGKIRESVFSNLPSEKVIDLSDPNLSIGDIFSAALNYIFIIAGLGLFVFLVIGGFELLTSAGNPEKIKAAQTKLTSAFIGFLIIFVSYWLVQIIEVVFGITILG